MLVKSLMAKSASSEISHAPLRQEHIPSLVYDYWEAIMQKSHCPARSSSTFQVFTRLSCVATLVTLASCSSYKPPREHELTYYLYRPDYLDTAFEKDSPNKQVSDVDS